MELATVSRCPVSSKSNQSKHAVLQSHWLLNINLQVKVESFSCLSTSCCCSSFHDHLLLPLLLCLLSFSYYYYYRPLVATWRERKYFPLYDCGECSGGIEATASGTSFRFAASLLPRPSPLSIFSLLNVDCLLQRLPLQLFSIHLTPALCVCCPTTHSVVFYARQCINLIIISMTPTPFFNTQSCTNIASVKKACTIEATFYVWKRK